MFIPAAQLIEKTEEREDEADRDLAEEQWENNDADVILPE